MTMFTTMFSTMKTPYALNLLLTMLIIFLLLPSPAQASCECGYTMNLSTGNASLSTSTTATHLFTELLESDFLHLRNLSRNTDWRRQNFTVSAAQARGPYGMNFTLANFADNPLPMAMEENGHGDEKIVAGQWPRGGAWDGDAGLVLSVSGGTPASGFVAGAELDSARVDMFYGSYRARFKVTGVKGTCSAFFWYFSDSQEIDMEFLSEQFDHENRIYPVNLVLQSEESVRAGYNAANSGNYIVANLTFDPSADFHEYRIDFVPSAVLFYADGEVIGTLETSAIPTSPGHMILTQWSNGNPLWSYGPPAEQANLTVAYVKAYFNSSDPSRHMDWQKRCVDVNAVNATCEIPDLNGSSGAADAGSASPDPSSFFFFSQMHNATFNQTVYRDAASATFTKTVWLRDLMMCVGVIFVLLG